MVQSTLQDILVVSYQVQDTFTIWHTELFLGIYSGDKCAQILVWNAHGSFTGEWINKCQNPYNGIQQKGYKKEQTINLPNKHCQSQKHYAKWNMPKAT
jgi:hypothetical protein